MFRNLSSIINFSTFRAEGREWRQFGKTLFLVVGGTLLLLMAVILFLSWRLGETVPDEEAAREQIKNPTLIWNEGDAYQPSFKVLRAGQVRPDVLIMGQSRVSQYRSAMFRPYSFYNLGKISWSFGVYSQLFEQLPADYKPKVVIISLDYFNLNPLYLSNYAHELAPPPKLLGAWRHILSSLCQRPDLIFAGRHDAEGRPTIGLDASYYGDGVRLDGSETLPLMQLNTAGRNPHLFETVRWNSTPIFYGDAVSEDELRGLEKFAALVHSRGATLIGVQMPIYGPVMRHIEQDPQYGILADFQRRVASGYFDHLGVIFLDYSKLTPYCDDYRYFIDAFHPSEATVAHVVLQMASDPRVKAVLPDLDTAALQRKLDEDQKADQHMSLYHDEF